MRAWYFLISSLAFSTSQGSKSHGSLPDSVGAVVSPALNELRVTDESESARRRRGAVSGLDSGLRVGIGNEAEGESGEDERRRRHVTDRRIVFCGGVGGGRDPSGKDA